MDHGDEKTRSTERHIQYLIMQSGGAGNGILTEGIWNACWQQDSCSCCEKIWGGTPWHTTIDFASADDMTRLKTFYTSLPWWNLTPRFDDPLWSDFKDRKTSALSSDANRTYVAYFWNADTSTGILKNLQVDKTYSARWYDPVKGSYLPIGTFVAGTDGLWSIPFKPDRKDWLLLVARE
jgi:hypothetical protein